MKTITLTLTLYQARALKRAVGNSFNIGLDDMTDEIFNGNRRQAISACVAAEKLDDVIRKAITK